MSYLEEIKMRSKSMALMTDPPIYYREVKEEHYKHLIEQAERVQDLEGDAENIYRANHDYSRRNDILTQQNKRYREAINFAIDYLKNSDIRQVQLVVTGLKSALESDSDE